MNHLKKDEINIIMGENYYAAPSYIPLKSQVIVEMVFSTIRYIITLEKNETIKKETKLWHISKSI